MTIGEIGGIVAFLGGLIGGIITLIKYAKNGLKEMLRGEFQGINNQIADIKEDVDEIREIGKNNEILLMINTQPEKVDEIERSFKDYKALGGNGYIDSLIEAWREEYEREFIKTRIKRKEKKNG